MLSVMMTLELMINFDAKKNRSNDSFVVDVGVVVVVAFSVLVVFYFSFLSFVGIGG